MARRKADCTELEQMISDVALTIGMRPGITIDGIVAEMQQKLPWINRDMVTESIVAANRTVQEELSDVSKQLAEVRREARVSESLKKTIDEYRKHIENGTLPQKKGQSESTTAVNALREVKRALSTELRNSEPAKAARIQQAIDRLDEKEQKIVSGALKTTKKPSEYETYEKLERALFERDSKRRKINGMIRAMKPLTFWQKAAEPFNFSRALITSIDFSALLRQGGFIAFSHPIRTVKKVPRMFHVFFDKDVEKIAYEIESEAMNDPRAPLMLRFKLHQSALDDRYGLAPQEERFATRTLDWFAKRFPKAAKWDLIKRSQLAYTVMLNEIRRDSFNAMADALTKNGDIMTQEEGMAIANYINIATGRGDLGDFEQAANLLNAYFFAPKYVVSRFQLASFNPVRKSWSQKRVRNMIVQEYVRYMAGIGSVIGLTYLAAMATAGDDEEVSFGFDPRSSDFLKLRVGNTRLDFFSGLGQTVVLASRLATGETKSTQGGGVREIRGEGVGYGRDDAWDVKGRFERYKLNPLAGTAVNLATGKNAVGEEVTFWSTVYDLTIPLSNREIASAYQEHGFSRGTAMGIANLFGVGIQSYGKKNSTGIRPLRPLN